MWTAEAAVAAEVSPEPSPRPGRLPTEAVRAWAIGWPLVGVSYTRWFPHVAVTAGLESSFVVHWAVVRGQYQVDAAPRAPRTDVLLGGGPAFHLGYATFRGASGIDYGPSLTGAVDLVCWGKQHRRAVDLRLEAGPWLWMQFGRYLIPMVDGQLSVGLAW